MKKRLKIMLSVTAVVIMAAILMLPGTIGSQSSSMYVTRMYGDTMEGPWSDTSSETTKYVLEITSNDSQTTIIIQEAQFLWESPESTLVFKVGNKMFSLTNVDSFELINLKCDPEKAVELREKYDSITPGWHMNKKHWNSLHMNNSLSDRLINELTSHSYDLVFNYFM